MSFYDDDELEGSEVLSDWHNRALQGQVWKNISAVQAAGSFATTGPVENFVLPGIQVDGVGDVSLPLSSDDARALISVSRHAPFGKGLETLVDAAVRKTWEIDASKVTFANPAWQSCLTQLIRKVHTELGASCDIDNIRAEFYKMLLYDEGAMFKPHRDVEKAPGMFGTLVVCLPSFFEGGVVELQHHHRLRSIDTSSASAFGASYIAWYADVLHEIQPVTAGVRWVLTYNLVQHTEDLQSATRLETQTQGLNDILAEWEVSDGPHALFYPFEHQYTTGSFTRGQLKGHDSPRTNHVAAACHESGKFYVFLGNIETAHVCRQERDDEVQGPFLLNCQSLHGKNLMAGPRLPIDKTFVLTPSYPHRTPDLQRGGEHLGNEHADVEKFFRDSVRRSSFVQCFTALITSMQGLAIVRKRYLLDFLTAGCPVNGTVPLLFKRIIEYVEMDSSDLVSRELLVDICSCTLRLYDRAILISSVAEAALVLRDDELFKRAIDRTSTGFVEGLWRKLGAAIDVRQPTATRRHLVQAFTKTGTVRDMHKAMRAFASGYEQVLHLDQSEVAFHQGWMDMVFFKAIQKIENVDELDICVFIDLLWQRTSHFRQFVAYQCIRKFVLRFLDSDWIFLLAIDMCLHWQSVQVCHTFLRSLLDRISDAVWERFDLSRSIDYIHDCYPCENIDEEQAVYSSWIRNLHDLTGPDRQAQFLGLVQEQAPKLQDRQLVSFLPSFCREMLLLVDMSSSEIRICLKSLILLYVARAVGEPPVKPIDWARPEAVLHRLPPDEECSCFTDTNGFLMDPKTESRTFECGRHCCTWYWSLWDDLDVQEKEDGIFVKKTLLYWHTEYLKWKTPADHVLQQLKDFPEQALKICLADDYDSVMAIFPTMDIDERSYLDTEME